MQCILKKFPHKRKILKITWSILDTIRGRHHRCRCQNVHHRRTCYRLRHRHQRGVWVCLLAFHQALNLRWPKPSSFGEGAQCAHWAGGVSWQSQVTRFYAAASLPHPSAPSSQPPSPEEEGLEKIVRSKPPRVLPVYSLPSPQCFFHKIIDILTYCTKFLIHLIIGISNYPEAQTFQVF